MLDMLLVGITLLTISVWRRHQVWYPLMDRFFYPMWLIHRFELVTPLSYQMNKDVIRFTLLHRTRNREYPVSAFIVGFSDPEEKRRYHMAQIQTERHAAAIQAIMDRVESRMCL